MDDGVTCLSPAGFDAGAGEAAPMQRMLITAGVLIALVGLLWPWVSKLPLGRLPGDIMIDRPGFKLFAPFTTMVVVSLVLSLLVWLLRR
jgi:hypothetical protein